MPFQYGEPPKTHGNSVGLRDSRSRGYIPPQKQLDEMIQDTFARVVTDAHLPLVADTGC